MGASCWRPGVPTVANLWGASDATVGCDPSGVTDSAPGLNFWLTAKAGGILALDPGTYRVKSSLIYKNSNTHLVGAGFGATTILVDDSSGNIGDVFNITNLQGCGLHNLTIDAVSPRSAGDTLKIAGGASVTGIDVLSPARHVIEDVHMIRQFNGMHVLDSVSGSIRTWLLYVNRGLWQEFGAGGTGIWMDCGTVAGGSPGASQFIANLFLSNSAGLSSTALSAIRVSGGGDLTFDNVETWGWTNGVNVDAPSGRLVQAFNTKGCFFDTNSGDSVLISPNAAATVTRSKWTNTWIGNSNGNGFNLVGAAVTDMQFDNCGVHSLAGAGKWGVIMNGCANNSFTGLHVGPGAGATNAGVLFTGGATNCGVVGRRVNVTGKSYQIDSGCSKSMFNSVDTTGSASGTDAGTGSVLVGNV